MKDFTIFFRFEERGHTATIHITRADNLPLHLHINNISPAITDLLYSCHIIYEADTKNFILFPHKGTTELADIILTAIKEYDRRHHMIFTK